LLLFSFENSVQMCITYFYKSTFRHKRINALQGARPITSLNLMPDFLNMASNRKSGCSPIIKVLMKFKKQVDLFTLKNTKKHEQGL